MASELRQRITVNSPSSNMPLRNTSGVALAAPVMLGASPQHHGYVLKLHIPLLFSVLPLFLQRIVVRSRILSCFLAPQWKRRYLILLGSFLYKFTNDSDASKEPKGSPVAMESVDINMIVDNDHVRVACESLPAGHAVFCVGTLRKAQYFAVPNQEGEEASTWIASLRQARQEAITRSMGHAKTGSYPSSWTHYDQLGQRLLERKERIRAKLEDKNLGEMEMSNFGEGGPLPRGYYG